LEIIIKYFLNAYINSECELFLSTFVVTMLFLIMWYSYIKNLENDFTE